MSLSVSHRGVVHDVHCPREEGSVSFVGDICPLFAVCVGVDRLPTYSHPLVCVVFFGKSLPTVVVGVCRLVFVRAGNCVGVCVGVGVGN